MMQNYKHDVSPDWGLATQMVHGGLTRSQHAETAEAIYMTSGYVYQSAEEAQAAFDNSKPRFVYGRFGNPTVAMFEERMALLEGAEAARATASGMAAVFASIACLVKAGDRVVASDALFGSCNYRQEILPKWGIEDRFVDGATRQWRKALSKPTKVVLKRRPSQPAHRRSQSGVRPATPPRAGDRRRVSRRRCCSGRSDRRRFRGYSATNTHDGQVAASAASSSAPRNTSTRRCSPSSATPARA
jgi:hypothetical protein